MGNTLTQALCDSVLDRLDVRPAAPDLPLLQRLISAYVQVVPWESVSRICRRAAVADPAARPRWPAQFWAEALRRGAGGTCFESNYAFQALLGALGYQTYLTINNMGDSIGCHTAVVVHLEDALWLADVGIPLAAPLELHPRLASVAVTPLLTYMAVPEDFVHYRIEREPHPQPYVFTLVNRPVTDGVYRAATAADYGPEGLFLERVIVNKVIEGRAWRFDSDEDPPVLASFAAGARFDEPISGDVATAVAARFGLERAMVRQALGLLDFGRRTPAGL